MNNNINRINNIFEHAKNMPKINVAVVAPETAVTLASAVEAAKKDIINPILIGSAEKIQAIATEISEDISNYELIISSKFLSKFFIV